MPSSKERGKFKLGTRECDHIRCSDAELKMTVEGSAQPSQSLPAVIPG